MLRCRKCWKGWSLKFWKAGVGYSTSDSATLVCSSFQIKSFVDLSTFALKSQHLRFLQDFTVWPKRLRPKRPDLFRILTPCTSTQRKLENEQRKSYWILISSCWPTDIWLFNFYRKRGLGPDQIHYNLSRLWSRLHTTLAQITWITPKLRYTVLKIFSPFRIFEQLALALQTEFALKFFAVLNVLFKFRILLLPLKIECVLNSLYWKYILYHWGFLSNLRLPWKTELPWNFSLYWIHFLPFRIFQRLCTYLEKQSLPWKFSLYWISFLNSEFLSNLRLPWKQCALNSLYWNIFSHSGFLSNLRLPWKQSLPRKFSSRGAAAPPRPPASYAYVQCIYDITFGML